MQVGFISETHIWINIQKSIAVRCHIDAIKKKNRKIFSKAAKKKRKESDKIPYPFTIKKQYKVRTEGAPSA